MGPTSGAAVTRTNMDGSYQLSTTRTHTIPTVSRGDEAFGKPVSLDARTEALELLVEIFGCPPLASDMAVSEAADLMEQDHPDAALRSLMTVCDLTGAYDDDIESPEDMEHDTWLAAADQLALAFGIEEK